MQKQTFLLRNIQILRNLKAELDNLPLNEEFPLEVKISDPKRTLPQNDMFHALCGNVAGHCMGWQYVGIAGLEMYFRIRTCKGDRP